MPMGPAPTIHNTLGLLFNVAIITAALWGAGSLQGWMYFRKYSKRDPIGTRLLIAFIMVADTVQEAMICEAVYQYAVTMHDDPLAMTHMVKTILIELFFAGAIGFAVQQFYCYRIYRLSNNNFWLAGTVVCNSPTSIHEKRPHIRIPFPSEPVPTFSERTFHVALIFGYTIVTLGYANLGDLIRQSDWATALNVMSAATDLAITFAMIGCLHGKKTGFKKSTDMINRMIIFTFNTGILTSLFSVADVIAVSHRSVLSEGVHSPAYELDLSVKAEHHAANIHLHGFFPDTGSLKLGSWILAVYTNSILVTLNSREYIKGGTSVQSYSDHETISLGRFATQSGGGVNTRTGRGFEEPQHTKEIAIRIEKSTLHVGYFGRYNQPI
ncbi:hypothetical protein PQX77_012816 [Marasmius sp. AFHP31]|nr:hypothetical protein PQX77_012816 [Marasmius sp. AFHP31]